METVVSGHPWGLGDLSVLENLAKDDGKALLLEDPSGNRYVRKRKSSAAAAADEGAVLEWLAAQSCPVSPFILTSAGGYSHELDGLEYALYRWLPGTPVAHLLNGNAIGATELYGEACALGHASLRDYHPPRSLRRLRILDQLTGWVRETLEKDPSEGAAELLRWCVRELQDVSSCRSGFIYRDINPHNVLVDGDRITGLIDLDRVREGPLVFDVGYAAGGVASVQTETADLPTLVSRFLHGYSRHGTVTDSDISVLSPMLVAIQLMFAMYWHTIDGASEARDSLDRAFIMYEARDEIQRAAAPTR